MKKEREIELAPGTYKIEIKKENYHDKSENIEIKRGEKINKKYELLMKSGNIKFSIVPFDSNVEMIKEGKTVEKWQGMKQLKNIMVGNYTIRAKKEGYKEITQNIIIKENQTEEINIKMEESKNGTLVITAKTDGELYIDGVYKGMVYKSQGKNMEVIEGEHTIKMSYGESAIDKEEYTVNIEREKTRTVEFVYVPKPKVPDSMVLVESAGKSFTMGDTAGGGYDDEVKHKVSFTYSYYIGKYEVTQKEYQSLMGNNPAKNYGVGDNYPVYYVTWWDAIKYCNAMNKKEGLPKAYDESTGDLLDENGRVTTDIKKVRGYRLPTEAEWEYAAKGGSKSQGYKYSGSNNVGEVAEYEGNNDRSTKPVGGKKPNELGIYDMSGNVWEWCSDWYGAYMGDATDPYMGNKASNRVDRGGSWLNSTENVRAAYRYYDKPDSSDFNLGFRLSRRF